ncbi:MAG: hypothetical protein GY795_29070 [Desulfobacterales bacterium]|nr:hypothetical protein [Desulfobacterales bacterium]
MTWNHLPHRKKPLNLCPQSKGSDFLSGYHSLWEAASCSMENYDYAVIRELVGAAFDSEDLIIFCSDRFSDVAELFTTGQTKRARVHLLIEHVKRHDLTEELLGSIRERMPYQYKKFEPDLKVFQLNSDRKPERKKEERRSESSGAALLTLLCFVAIAATVTVILFVFFPIRAKGENVWEQLVPAVACASVFCSVTLAKVYKSVAFKTVIILLVPLCMSFSIVSSAFILDISPLEIIRVGAVFL